MTDQPTETAPKTKPPRKPRPTAKQIAPAPKTKPKPAAQAQRPYLLDSAQVTDDLSRHYKAALAQIDAIDADCLAVEQVANDAIQSIQARLDADLDARCARRNDLTNIVEMTARALNLTPPAGSPSAQITAALQDLRLTDETTDQQGDRA